MDFIRLNEGVEPLKPVEIPNRTLWVRVAGFAVPFKSNEPVWIGVTKDEYATSVYKNGSLYVRERHAFPPVPRWKQALLTAIAFTLLLLVIFSPVQAQGGRVMDCTGASVLYYTTGDGVLRNQVSANTMQQLYALSGDEFFNEAGYYWEWESDVQLIAFMAESEPPESQAMVTIYQSPSNPAWLYVIVYNNSQQTTDSNGNHLGNHPCNNIRVPSGSLSFGSVTSQSQQSNTYQQRQVPTVTEADRQFCNWIANHRDDISTERYNRHYNSTICRQVRLEQ